MNKYPKEFLEKLNSVMAKRPRAVIQHIIKHGHVTTQELEELYGCKHPPRAARDVRERGIPLEMYRVPSTDGKTIAAYGFGNPSDLGNPLAKSKGRTALSKALKRALVEKHGARCFASRELMDETALQVDHRIPCEIAGECDEREIERFMLLSPSANRAKSWACEHCENWKNKDVAFCSRCFWAHPEDYDHVAGRREKLLPVTFVNGEVADYNRLVELSGDNSPQATLKVILHEHLRE